MDFRGIVFHRFIGIAYEWKLLVHDLDLLGSLKRSLIGFCRYEADPVTGTQPYL